MKEKEMLNEKEIAELGYVTLEKGEIIQQGDRVGQIENWSRNWYLVGPALVGEKVQPEYWIKRKK